MHARFRLWRRGQDFKLLKSVAIVLLAGVALFWLVFKVFAPLIQKALGGP